MIVRQVLIRRLSSDPKRCPNCYGTGKDGCDKPCKACEGSGDNSKTSVSNLPASTDALPPPDDIAYEAKASLCCSDGRAGRSRRSRTFRTNESRVNGFSRKATSGPSTTS